MQRALVLSGGGARGSYQVGMLKELILNQGLDFQVIRGVSVGWGDRPGDGRARTIEAPALSGSGGRRTDSARGKLLIWWKDGAPSSPGIVAPGRGRA